MFYDWYDTGLYEDTLRLNGFNQSDIIIDQPGLSGSDAVRHAAGRPTNPSVIHASAFLVMPTVTRFSVGVEHQVTSWLRLRANFFRQHGTNLFRA